MPEVISVHLRLRENKEINSETAMHGVMIGNID